MSDQMEIVGPNKRTRFVFVDRMLFEFSHDNDGLVAATCEDYPELKASGSDENEALHGLQQLIKEK